MNRKKIIFLHGLVFPGLLGVAVLLIVWIFYSKVQQKYNIRHEALLRRNEAQQFIDENRQTHQNAVLMLKAALQCRTDAALGRVGAFLSHRVESEPTALRVLSVKQAEVGVSLVFEARSQNGINLLAALRSEFPYYRYSKALVERVDPRKDSVIPEDRYLRWAISFEPIPIK